MIYTTQRAAEPSRWGAHMQGDYRTSTLPNHPSMTLRRSSAKSLPGCDNSLLTGKKQQKEKTKIMWDFLPPWCPQFIFINKQ